MKVHEYQAKEILSRFGVKTPLGRVASTPEEAEKAARDLGAALFAVKAQVLAGGRGKAGGIKIAKSPEEVRHKAESLLGSRLFSPQTGPEGVLVRKLLVEEGVSIKRELYAGAILDRSLERVVLIASTEGGMEIEEIAHTQPEAIIKVPVDPFLGLAPYQSRELARKLGFSGTPLGNASSAFLGLYQAFVSMDCSLAEINPLVETEGGDVIALDAKISLDDSALFRHKELLPMRDRSEEDELEVMAADAGVNYVKLTGRIGCMVNGAGLAMATMDLIKLCGEEPANFLDVGGGANTEQVKTAFRILCSDPKVKAILVNIFGGIMRCDVIANGILQAVKEVNACPVVVRLEGTNQEMGRKILSESGLRIILATGMGEAAEMAAKLVRG